ncbi:MAG: hypothetical protein ACP5K2_04290 [bacterium]
MDYFFDLLSKGVERKEFADIDPEVSSCTIIDFVLGLLIQRLFASGKENWEELAKKGLEIIVRGLGDDRR